MSKTAAGETEVPPAFLLQPQNEISRIKTKNPNPLPIGIKFGFLQCVYGLQKRYFVYASRIGLNPYKRLYFLTKW